MTVAGSSCPILLDPELLGHAGIETTQIYTHLDTSRLHHMVRDLHPLNEEERTTAA
jgi:integrase/recombinase XerD